MTSAPLCCSIRRIMLTETSCPSNKLDGVTNRTGPCTLYTSVCFIITPLFIVACREIICSSFFNYTLNLRPILIYYLSFLPSLTHHIFAICVCYFLSYHLIYTN